MARTKCESEFVAIDNSSADAMPEVDVARSLEHPSAYGDLRDVIQRFYMEHYLSSNILYQEIH
jgi:hypothetical protein